MLAATALLVSVALCPNEVLAPGETVKGEVGANARAVDVPEPPGRWADVLLRGEPFEYDAPAGTSTIELRSYLFDPYLVVLGRNGAVVAEDDDGLGGGNARVTVEAVAGGERFTVWACAKTLRTGGFELRSVLGDAPIPEAEAETPEELRALSRDLFEHYGLGSEDAIQMLLKRGYELQSRRRHREVLLVAQPAIDVLAGLPEHSVGRARLQYMTMLSLGSGGRVQEACEVGRECLPVLLAQPEMPDHGNLAYTFAYWLWRAGAREEGLEWSERGYELQRRILPEGAPLIELARALQLSYRRANGLWEEPLAALADELAAPLVLAPGDQLERETRLNGLRQHTDILRAGYSDRSWMECLPVRVEASGLYTFELRSFAFDSYLVLRDATGALVAEDDDARGLTDARVVTELEAGQTYLLEPTSLHGAWGPYTLRVFAGAPEERTAWERRAEDLAEAESCMTFALQAKSGLARRAFDRARDLYTTLGRHGDAVRAAERNLEVRRRLGPGAETAGLFFLAQSLRRAGRAAEALPLITEVAERERRRGGPGSESTATLGEIASVRWARGEIEEALALRARLEQRARERYGEGSAALLGAERVRGRMLAAEGRYPEAIEIGQRVADRYRADPNAESSGLAYVTAYALEELGDRQTWVGEFDAALANLEEAQRLFTIAYGEASSTTAWARMLVGWTLAYAGEPDRALEELRRAREIMQETGSSALDTCLANEADVHAVRGEYEQAFELACRAVDLNAGRIAGFLATLPEALRLRRLRTGARHLGIALGAGRRVPGSEQATYARVLAMKEVIGRSLVQSRASVRASLDPKALSLVEELQELQSELAQAFYDEKSKKYVERLQRRRVKVEDELALLGSTGDAVGSAREVTVDELRAALPPGAVLVDFHVAPVYRPPTFEGGATVAPRWWLEPVVTAWVVKEGAAGVARVELGPADELEELARELGGALLAARGVTRVDVDAGSAGKDRRDERRDALRRRLWDPLAPHIGDAELVFVSTADFLGSVPFEVLQRDDGSYLLEHHAFVLLSDAAQLADERPVGKGSLLLVGNVDYDDAADDAPDDAELAQRPVTLAAAIPIAHRGPSATFWSPLPFTATEVQRLAELHAPGSPDEEPTRLTGRAASVSALKAALPDHTWIHIATHGFFRTEPAASPWGGRPGIGEGVSGLFPGLLSGLVLAGANRATEPGTDDGLLTAEELTWLDLSSCELVTLSACESGLGSARGGEGLVGLRRAFHQAGARTVVASLWAVEDEATARLMEGFYRNLWIEGLPRREALRAAQLELLARNRAEHGDPRPWTWGAFVLSGEWR